MWPRLCSDLITEVSLKVKLWTKSRSQKTLWLLNVMKVCSTSILEIICRRCRFCNCWNLLMWSPHPIENIIFKHVSCLCSDTILQVRWPSVRLTDVLSLRCRSFAVQSDRRWSSVDSSCSFWPLLYLHVGATQLIISLPAAAGLRGFSLGCKMAQLKIDMNQVLVQFTISYLCSRRSSSFSPGHNTFIRESVTITVFVGWYIVPGIIVINYIVIFRPFYPNNLMTVS